MPRQVRPATDSPCGAHDSLHAASNWGAAFSDRAPMLRAYAAREICDSSDCDEEVLSTKQTPIRPSAASKTNRLARGEE